MFFCLCLISLTKTLEQSLCSKTLGISIHLKIKKKNIILLVLVSAYRSFSCLAILHTEELQLLFQSQSSHENHLRYKINKMIQFISIF